MKECRLLWKAWKRSKDHEKEGLEKGLENLWENQTRTVEESREDLEMEKPQGESKAKILLRPFQVHPRVAGGKENRDAAYHRTGAGGPYKNPDK